MKRCSEFSIDGLVSSPKSAEHGAPAPAHGRGPAHHQDYDRVSPPPITNLHDYMEVVESHYWMDQAFKKEYEKFKKQERMWHVQKKRMLEEQEACDKWYRQACDKLVTVISTNAASGANETLHSNLLKDMSSTLPKPLSYAAAAKKSMVTPAKVWAWSASSPSSTAW